jgi:hypothetical protein
VIWPDSFNNSADLEKPGRHRYFHKLYALDVVLPDLRQPAKAALEAARKGHVLEQAELVGTYQRS